MNAFDAALALIALGISTQMGDFAAPLRCIIGAVRRGRGHGPYRAYQWNKMKTPTRILVGGPEVTSAFVLMGLALARKKLAGAFPSLSPPSLSPPFPADDTGFTRS